MRRWMSFTGSMTPCTGTSGREITGAGGKYNCYVAVECLKINRNIKSEGNLLLETDT